jgi:hypothetical protein
VKKSKFTEQQIALPCADWVPMRSGDKGGTRVHDKAPLSIGELGSSSPGSIPEYALERGSSAHHARRLRGVRCQFP